LRDWGSFGCPWRIVKLLRATTTILVFKKRPPLSLRKNRRLDESPRSVRGNRAMPANWRRSPRPSITPEWSSGATAEERQAVNTRSSTATANCVFCYAPFQSPVLFNKKGLAFFIM
jgi:hypothetical protein